MLSNTQHPTLNNDYTNFEVYAEKQGFVGYYSNDNRDFIGKSLFVKYDSPEQLIEAIYSSIGQNLPEITSFIRDEWEIHYKLDNFQFDGNVIRFEVQMKSKWSNLFSIENISFGFKYDPEIFGPNILSNPNTEIQLANEFTQSLQLSTNQISTNEGKINLQKSAFSSAEHFSQDYRKLLAIQIPVENLNIQTEPYFELLLEEGEETQLFANQTGEFFTPTSIVPNIKACPFEAFCQLAFEITEVLPSTVAAGILGDQSLIVNNDANSLPGTITILGSEFVNLPEENLSDFIPSQYRVVFPEIDGIIVDDEVIDIEMTPFASDYILWDDDKIIVRVPTAGYVINDDNIDLNSPQALLVPSTGKIKVQKPEGLEQESPEDLEIAFAHWNNFKGDTVENHQAIRIIYRDLFVLPTDFSDGYLYSFTPDFISNMPSGSVGAVNKALETWRCNTKVSNSSLMQPDTIQDPGYGTIDWGTITAGLNADSRTVIQTNLFDCSEGEPEQVSVVTRLGITFSDEMIGNESIWTAQGVVEDGKFDVESTALHEFGHNLLLGHVEDNDAVMEKSTLSGIFSVDRDLENVDISGGQHVVQASSLQEIVCPNPQVPGDEFTLLPIVPFSNSCTNSTTNLEELGLTIEPNPNNGIFFIRSEENIIASLFLYDLNGKLLDSKKSEQKGVFVSNKAPSRRFYYSWYLSGCYSFFF